MNSVCHHEVCMHFSGTPCISKGPFLKRQSCDPIKQLREPPVEKRCPEMMKGFTLELSRQQVVLNMKCRLIFSLYHSHSPTGCTALSSHIALVTKHWMWRHCHEVFEVSGACGVVRHSQPLCKTQIWKPSITKCPWSCFFFFSCHLKTLPHVLTLNCSKMYFCYFYTAKLCI